MDMLDIVTATVERNLAYSWTGGDYIEIAYCDRPWDYVDVIYVGPQVAASGMPWQELVHSKEGARILADAIVTHYDEYGEYLLAHRDDFLAGRLPSRLEWD